MIESSSTEALELFAELGARQKTWYYEINVLASLGVRVSLLSAVVLSIPFFFSHIDFYKDCWYLRFVVASCVFASTTAFWRLRQRFEAENGLTPHRKFLRLHSRLTYFDIY